MAKRDKANCSEVIMAAIWQWCEVSEGRRRQANLKVEPKMGQLLPNLTYFFDLFNNVKFKFK